MEDSKVSQRNSSRYEMGQTTRSEWESDMRAHRELLRNVIEEHREGRDSAVNMSEMLDDLALPEEIVYAPISTLASSNPPMMAQGPSGWIYHSTSLFCLRPHHFPRRVAINIVESAPFDPFILITIMCNCFTMAWASPMDEPGTWKQDVLAVRASARAQTSANKGTHAGQGRGHGRAVGGATHGRRRHACNPPARAARLRPISLPPYHLPSGQNSPRVGAAPSAPAPLPSSAV